MTVSEFEANKRTTRKVKKNLAQGVQTCAAVWLKCTFRGAPFAMSQLSSGAFDGKGARRGHCQRRSTVDSTVGSPSFTRAPPPVVFRCVLPPRTEDENEKTRARMSPTKASAGVQPSGFGCMYCQELISAKERGGIAGSECFLTEPPKARRERRASLVNGLLREVRWPPRKR